MNLEDFNFDDIKRSFSQFQFRRNRRERYRLYRKMEGMLRMNESLSRTLDRLYLNTSEMGKYPDRPAAVALREWFMKDRSGVSLSEAMNGWIPSSDLYMIRAGEESGTLSKALSSIQAMGERSREMSGAVKYAVSYPIFMFLLVSAVLWMFGVNLIQNMKATAPPKVMAAMEGVGMVSDFIRDYGILTVCIIIGIGLIIFVTLPRWRGPLRAKIDMYPPWAWYRVLQGAGFMLGLSSLLGSQVPLRRSLEILEEEGTPWLKERVSSARQEVLKGRNLGEALRTGRFNFPDPFVAIDLEVLAERADVGLVIESVTQEWIREQIDDLKRQAEISRNVGMFVVGGVIAWAMMSVFKVVALISDSSGMGGGS